VVQGDAAAAQVANAVRGFDALGADGIIPRPDLLIVARGGGSVEDLWAFNDEALARAVASASIPIISAVGHETDTTLIDFVSDRRAPTPTGAAEIATPVLADLRFAVADLERRLDRAGGRLIEERCTRLRAAARGLPTRPEDLLALPQQRLDLASNRLSSGLQRNVSIHGQQLVSASARLGLHLLNQRLTRADERLIVADRRLQGTLTANVAAHQHRLLKVSARLSPDPLHRRLDQRASRLSAASDRLTPTMLRRLDRDEARLAALSRALLSLDPKRPKPGFARVESSDGTMIASAAALTAGQAVNLVFADGSRGAHIDADDGTPAPRSRPAAAATRPRPPLAQGDLF
jgi:exodeoxyribonuclease VII large subunit